MYGVDEVPAPLDKHGQGLEAAAHPEKQMVTVTARCNTMFPVTGLRHVDYEGGGGMHPQHALFSTLEGEPVDDDDSGSGGLEGEHADPHKPVEIYWEKEKAWYPACIRDVDENGISRIIYDDETVEMRDMRGERWRYVGGKKGDKKGAQGRKKKKRKAEEEPPLSAVECIAIAVEEGLELVPSANLTGFKNVSRARRGDKFQATSFSDRLALATAEEAALACARHQIGSVVATRLAAIDELRRAKRKTEKELSAADAVRIAAEEGLELVPSDTNNSGFKGVFDTRTSELFKAQQSKYHGLSLGSFATTEEATLARACYLGPVGAAWTSAADVARIAAEDGLQLVPSDTSNTGFKGVFAAHCFRARRGQLSLASFATAEEAALAYARARNLGPVGAAAATADATANVWTAEEDWFILSAVELDTGDAYAGCVSSAFWEELVTSWPPAEGDFKCRALNALQYRHNSLRASYFASA